MIRGIYLNEMTDDCSLAIGLQKDVMGDDYRDEIAGDQSGMPKIHILLYGEDGLPAGSVRFVYSLDGRFVFDQLFVPEAYRHRGYADFMMHMMFDKCLQSGANALVSYDTQHMPEYFKKYDFVVYEDHMSQDLLLYNKNHACHH